MSQEPTFEDQADLEAGFEIAKILAQAGMMPDAPAYIITWGRLTEALARTLNEYGIPACELEEAALLNLVQAALNAFETDDVLSWREILRLLAILDPTVTGFLVEPTSDDEGPLTEAYENATRTGDEEGYYIDGGTSADLFEEE